MYKPDSKAEALNDKAQICFSKFADPHRVTKGADNEDEDDDDDDNKKENLQTEVPIKTTNKIVKVMMMTVKMMIMITMRMVMMMKKVMMMKMVMMMEMVLMGRRIIRLIAMLVQPDCRWVKL